MKLTQKKASATHRVLVYGGPKTGKSELAGKLSEFYNLLWLDAEKGWVTLLKLPTAWQERINIVSIPDSRVFPIAAETWPKIIRGTPVFVCEIHGKAECALCKKEGAYLERICLNELGPDTIVVIDSLTQFTNSCIAHLTKAQPDDYKLQLDDWGNLRVLIDKFLSQVQAANYNIVCITHEELVPMEDGKVKLVPVSGSSKSSMNTAKYFDHVVYCEVKNKKHTFGSSTDFGLNMVTGSRTGIALEKNAVPSLLDIFTWHKDKGNVPVLNKVINREGVQIEITETEKAKAAIAAEQNRKQLEVKLNAIGTPQSNVPSQPINTQVGMVGLSSASTSNPTPGQVSLANMKAKAAELLKK